MEHGRAYAANSAVGLAHSFIQLPKNEHNNHQINFLICFFIPDETYLCPGYKRKAHEWADNRPIEYASVAIYQVAGSLLVTGALTDMEGVFEIRGVKPGKYYLTAQFMGYHTETVANVVVPGNGSIRLKTISLWLP